MDVSNLHQILRNLYDSMMPLCGELIGIAKAIGGLGALFYIAYRVWQSLARAEPIDVFPLLRPFAIGICIIFFPSLVLKTINGVMSPVVTGCHTMLESRKQNVESLVIERDRLEWEAIMRNPAEAYLLDNELFDAKLDEMGALDVWNKTSLRLERGLFQLQRNAWLWFKSILEAVYAAAGLILDVLRTFFLVVLSILGPLAFAFAIWDGFHNTLTEWVTRYIGIYLWLPVSDLFSTILASIHVEILQSEIRQFNDPTFIPDSTNTMFIIFMLIGIVGYFAVPTVSAWIIQSGGSGNYGRQLNMISTKISTFTGNQSYNAAKTSVKGGYQAVKGGVKYGVKGAKAVGKGVYRAGAAAVRFFTGK